MARNLNKADMVAAGWAGAATDVLPGMMRDLVAPQGVRRTISSFKQQSDIDDTASIIAAFAWSKANKGTVVGLPGQEFIVSGRIDYDGSYVSVDWQGAHIKSPVYAGDLFFWTSPQTPSDSVYRTKAGRAGFRNCLISGPGRAVTGFTAIVFDEYSNGSLLHNVRIQEADLAFRWGANTWCTEVGHFEVNRCRMAGYFPSGLANSGERVAVHDGTVSNSDYGFDNRGCAMHFSEMSMDYINNYYLDASVDGSFLCQHMHFEGNQNNTEWFRAQNGKTISIADSFIVMTNSVANQRTIPLGVATAVTRSAINFSGNMSIFQTQGWGTLTYLVQGYGTAPDSINLYTPGIPTPPTHSLNNILFDGANGLTLRDWVNTSTVSTQASRTTVAAETVGGTGGALKVNPAAGNIGRLELRLAVRPGAQIFFAGMWYNVNKGGTDGFYIVSQYFDRNGVLLGNTNSRLTANADTPAAYAPVRYTPEFAPAGAAFCRIAIGKGSAAEATSDGVGYMVLDEVYVSGSPGVRLASNAELPPPLVTRTYAANNVVGTDTVNYVDTTAAAVTITLPNAPLQVGTHVTIMDAAGTAATNNIIVNPNGATIRGATGNDTINTAWARRRYEYTGTGWVYAA